MVLTKPYRGVTRRYKNPLRRQKNGVFHRFEEYWLRASDGPGSIAQRSFFRCEVDGCAGEVSYKRLNKGRSRRCSTCLEADKYWKGHRVSDPWLRQRMDEYSHSKYAGKQIIHYLKCSTHGCNKSVSARHVKRTGRRVCIKCVGVRFRVPIWQTIQTRLRRRHKSDKSLITCRQIEMLCSIQHCGYCFDLLPARAEFWLQAATSPASSSAFFDQMEAGAGYSAGNVVPCCRSCNARKKHRTCAHHTLVFMLAIKGNWKDASAALEASNYLSALMAIQRHGFAAAAKDISQTLKAIASM